MHIYNIKINGGKALKIIIILLSLFMSVIIYPLSFIINNSLLLISVQVLIGGMIYILLSRIFRLESFMYIINMIKNRKKEKSV